MQQEENTLQEEKTINVMALKILACLSSLKKPSRVGELESWMKVQELVRAYILQAIVATLRTLGRHWSGDHMRLRDDFVT